MKGTRLGSGRRDLFLLVLRVLREWHIAGKDPWDEDPDQLRKRLGGWHPERFDLEAVKVRFDRGPRKELHSAGRGRRTGTGRKEAK